jgi:nucleoside-diphosphate-sugar epimerase
VKIAVLGGGGFVGGHVLRYLRANGYEARSIVRRRPSEPDPDYRIADACDVYELREAMRGCDAVVHAALGSNDVIVNSVAPVYAAAEAVGARRLIYISSGSVHGQAPAPGTNEDTPLSVRQACSYNNAKVKAERRLRGLRARGTVELVILRPTIVIGPGSRWVFDFADALENGTAYVVDKAVGILNSIYVDNLAYAVWLTLTAKQVDRQVFLLGDEETVRWSDLYRPIAEAFGVSFEDVRSVSPPAVRATFRQRYVEPLRTSDAVQSAMRVMPRSVKDGVKRTIGRAVRLARRGANRATSNQNPPASEAPIAAASPQSFVVPPEIAALHRCQWRLPHDKAARILGYVAPVSFAEGCERSIGWLKQRDRLSSRAS